MQEGSAPSGSALWCRTGHKKVGRKAELIVITDGTLVSQVQRSSPATVNRNTVEFKKKKKIIS